MSSRWHQEPGNGEWFYWERDEHGRDFKVYDAQAQSYQETPRSHSSHRNQRRTHGSPSSSRQTASHHDRRESEVTSRRPPDILEYPAGSNPIPIYHDPSYQSPTEYGQSRVGDAYPSHHASASYQDHTWIGSQADTSLAAGMTALTVGEASGNVQYTLEPLRHSSVPTTAYTGSTSAQWPSMTQPGPSGLPGTYYDKGQTTVVGQEPASRRYVTPTEVEQGTLDKSYKVRNQDYKKWFRVGRVFSTLFTDALGHATNEYDSQFLSTVSVVQYGEKVYSTIRRFVVVKFKPENKACTCLPVTTYNGRGIDKRGIRLGDHGQIYSGNTIPHPVDGLEKEPLRVRLSSGVRGLDYHSYINYGRPYTVQTNVKVKEVGVLDDTSRRLLRKYYKEVSLDDDDDNYSDTGPPRTAEDRAAILTGMGGAVTDTSYSYAGAYPSAFGSLDPSIGSPRTHESSSYLQRGSAWTGSSAYPSAGQGPGYASPTSSHPQMATSSINYSKSPVIDMTHPSSAPGYHPRDDRYMDSASHITDSASQTVPATDPYYSERQYGREYEQASMSQSPRDSRYPPVASSGQYDSTPVTSSSAWPATSSSSARQDTTYVVEEVVVLPTLEEAQASRSHRRHSSSQQGGNRRTYTRGGRDRDRDQEYDEDNERSDRRERSRHERRRR